MTAIRQVPVHPASEAEAYEETLQGLSYAEMLGEWESEVGLPLKGLNREERLYRHYSRYNWERMERVQSLYQPSNGLRNAAASHAGHQTWLFLTENWCADAAYSLPVVKTAAEAHGDADLRFLMRDSHLDVMERYLTGTARSIPVLVVFDSEGKELVRWGPKPKALAAHRADLIAQGADGRAVSAASIAWYDDEGWLAVEQELEQRFLAAANVGV